MKMGSREVIKNCAFESNLAKIDGGVLDSRTKSNVSISNCTIITNSAANDGTLLIYDMSTVYWKIVPLSAMQLIIMVEWCICMIEAM